MHRVVTAASLVISMLPLACADHNPAGPTDSAALDGFVQSLRQQGLNVSVVEQIPPSVNRFFSVPAQQIRVNDSQVNAFVYATARDAAAQAALISADGQPSPTMQVDWVSTPRFYRRDALIVLYVGCAAEIVQALQATMGTPVVTGSSPCNIRG